MIFDETFLLLIGYMRLFWFTNRH